MEQKSEILEGYVVDLACLRGYPQEQLLDRARVHTKKCTLMGHCVESGYGLVNEQGQVQLVDAKGTPDVVRAVEASSKDAGIRPQVSREFNEEEMETRRVEEF